MKVITPSAKVYDPSDTQINATAVEKAEFCARVCYNSLSDIKPGSAQQFVLATAKRGHGSVMEHGGIYLEYPSIDRIFLTDQPILQEIQASQYSTIVGNRVYTNLRAIYEGFRDWNNPDKPFLFDRHPEFFEAFISGGDISQFGGIKYFTPDVDDPQRRVTVDFFVDRGITHELVRHRALSFSQESTRYCNYAGEREREGSEITVIDPFFWDKDGEEYEIWRDTIARIEAAYMLLVQKDGDGYAAQPQEARSILPNSTKARLLMTGNLYQWREVFKLRLASGAHPQMREVTIPLHQWFKDNISATYFDEIKFPQK